MVEEIWETRPRSMDLVEEKSENLELIDGIELLENLDLFGLSKPILTLPSTYWVRKAKECVKRF